MKYLSFLILVTILTASASLTVRAADPPAKKSLDDQLLEGLDNELTRDLDNLPSLKPPKVADKPAGSTPQPTPPEIDGHDLGQPGEDRDPFSLIARQMRQVEAKIARDQAGADIQRQQSKIVDDLSALIEVLNQQCRGGNKGQAENPAKSPTKEPSQHSASGKSNSGNSPARDSTTKLHNEAVAKPDATVIRQSMKEAWGNLPEHVREQMLQTAVDEFLPKYELMIEQYFKRLAEERPSDSVPRQ